jgi:DNA mismatch repair ATPase MutS
LSLGMLMDITPHPSPLLWKEREKNLSSSVERDVIKWQEEFQVKESELEKELEKIDVNNLTPIEALNELVKLKGKLQK